LAFGVFTTSYVIVCYHLLITVPSPGLKMPATQGSRVETAVQQQLRSPQFLSATQAGRILITPVAFWTKPIENSTLSEP
jgi:hypothetical protein